MTDPVFGLEVPTAVPGVPGEVLTPRNTWADPGAYDAQAKKLAEMFRKNFAGFEKQVPEAVVNAGPVVRYAGNGSAMTAICGSPSAPTC